MFYEYKSLLIFSLISIGLALIILLASYVLALQKGDLEKLSPYECGFNPFQDARQEFDVKFYLVAILFIIFDLEISFLFPWAVHLNEILNPMNQINDIISNYYGYWTMLLFLTILTIGFVYEWKKGALNW